MLFNSIYKILMATRIKDWIIPYTWGIGIEITEDHVINVLLRAMNNLIHVNENRELYVDLQLDDWIQPDDDFPVWVTTWKILQEDWWLQSWIILNRKTTSWDYVRFIYANDGKLYYDPWTWVWIEIWSWWWWVQINVATASTLWLIKLGTDTKQTEPAVVATTVSGKTYPVQLNNDNQAVVNIPRENTTYTAGANISINQNNEISATIPSALVYKWNVSWIADLPSSWQTVWDTYFVEWEDAMYSRDWTQWNYVWWTWIDVSDLFNKTIDDSDDIVQWTTNLFVTQSEKNYWNNKQDPISAWTWINVSNNVVSNTLPFDPQNAGSLWQFLKKTNDWYGWYDIPWWWWGWTYTAWDWINISNSNVISNTAPFEPINQWRVGQVLKKSGTNSYYRADESWWWTAEQEVKVWLIPQEGLSQEDMQDITQRCLNEHHSAILNIDGAAKDCFVYWWHSTVDSVAHFYFLWTWVNRKVTSTANGDFTTLYHTAYHITFDWTTYTWTYENYYDNAGNFLTVENSGYTTPYMPTADYQPATKKYVDDRNRVWTQAQYDQLTPVNWVIYNIIPSS